MIHRNLPGPLRRHDAFLAKAERYFGLRPGSVRYEVNEQSVPDILSMPAIKTVVVGKKWLRLRDAEEQRKRAVHELMHIGAGMPHDESMRELGYYSDPHRDKLAMQVYQDVKRGGRRWDPTRWGLPAKYQNPEGSMAQNGGLIDDGALSIHREWAEKPLTPVVPRPGMEGQVLTLYARQNPGPSRRENVRTAVGGVIAVGVLLLVQKFRQG